jgi:hypothetical protein
MRVGGGDRLPRRVHPGCRNWVCEQVVERGARPDADPRHDCRASGDDERDHSADDRSSGDGNDDGDRVGDDGIAVDHNDGRVESIALDCAGPQRRRPGDVLHACRLHRRLDLPRHDFR